MSCSSCIRRCANCMRASQPTPLTTGCPVLRSRSRPLAPDLGLVHLWCWPPREGVLIYEAMKAGVAATGAEAGGRGGCLDSEWQAYRDVVLRILARRGIIDAAPEPPRTYKRS